MATDIDEESRDAERQNCPDTVTLLDAAELELPSVQERLKRTERLLRMLLMNAEPFYMTRAIQNMEDQLKQAEVRVKDLHTGFTVPMPQEQVEGLVQRLKDEEKQLENEEKQLRHLTRGPMLEYQVQHLHKLKEQLDALFERIRSMQERVEQCSQLGQ
jgi:DNA repair exonuclease SbcCD ATPase subunit